MSDNHGAREIFSVGAIPSLQEPPACSGTGPVCVLEVNPAEEAAGNVMAKRKKPKVSAPRKVKFLAVLAPEAIKQIKLKGIEKDVNASEILEEAVAGWMKRNRNADPKPLGAEAGEESDKRQFLSQMDASLIRDLKILAMDWRVRASAIVRQAVAEYLGREAKKTG